MIRSILKKELLKIRWYVGMLVLLGFGCVGYFALELRFEFANIEPESMMWYRFAQLGEKPYLFFSTLFMAVGIAIALVQFVHERFKNRLRIIAHLPIPMPQVLGWHLGVGLGVVMVLIGLVTLCVLSVMYAYYPPEIVWIAVKDFLFYALGAGLSYALCSAVVLEREVKNAFVKIGLGVITLFIFSKAHFELVDAFWSVVLLFFLWVCLDSFYSVKFQRITSFGFILLGIVSFGFVAYAGNEAYQKRYATSFTHYYLFYSPVKEDFVYQKNFGNHRFEYGVKGKETFGQKAYEALLPFVYWRDLDIQGRLPVKIGDAIFTKEVIQDSRLSLMYTPNDQEKKEVALYPLMNPKTTQGVITFPEHALSIGAAGIRAYNFDEGFNSKLTHDIDEHLNRLHVSFPLKGFWGKTTNLKPYDLGYLFLDAHQRLFNLKREDNVVSIKEIFYPKGITLTHISLNENTQKKVIGYAIDTHSTLYILDFDFNFHALDVSDFNAEKMKFQLISDPLYYLLRVDDGTNYRAVLFSKALEKLKEVSF